MTLSAIARYACTACSYSDSRSWMQCPKCMAWGTFKLASLTVPEGSGGGGTTIAAGAELAGTVGALRRAPHDTMRDAIVESVAPTAHRGWLQEAPTPERVIDSAPASLPQSITSIPEDTTVRTPTGIAPVDLVLGGGFVRGSVVILGGDAGVGKSTLSAQIIAGTGLVVLYATGEETVTQAAMRARRLDCAHERILIVAETDVDRILAHARALRPGILVIDSVQTLATTDLSSAPGAISQVRECTARVAAFAKASNTATLLIGHVTKDGSMAGPQTLAHLVDVVLSLEPHDDPDYPETPRRVLRSSKNRFGSTAERGSLEMTAEGLIARSGDDLDSDAARGESTTDVILTQLLERFQEAGGTCDPHLRDLILSARPLLAAKLRR